MSRKIYLAVFIGVLSAASFLLIIRQGKEVKAACSGQTQCYWNDPIYGCVWDYLTKQVGCGGKGSNPGECEDYNPCPSNPCQGGGCYWTSPGIPTPTTPPVSCSCGSWSGDSCGGGFCAATDRVETRSCNPAGCDAQSRCVADSSCSGGCTCSGWVNGACGGGACSLDERLQTRSCDPAGCSSETRCDFDPTCEVPSCSLGLGGNIPLDANSTASINPIVLQANGTVDSVTFTISDISVATVCDSATTPCPSGAGSYTDTSVAFNAHLTGKSPSPPTATLTVTGEMTDEPGGPITCTSDSVTVTVANPGAWWQVVGGDVSAGKTGSGNISSTIPGTCSLPSCNPVLIRNNLEGYPGVPSTGGSINPVSASSPYNWKAEGSSYSASEVHDYAFFEKKAQNVNFYNLTPSNITNSSITDASQLTSGPDINGYYWVRYDGNSFAGAPLTISGPLDLGDNKIVLFVKNANLNIDSSIALNDGLGTLSVIADMDIVVNGSVGGAADGVPELEGVYLADGQFITGSGNSQLHIRGSVSGLGIPSGGEAKDAGTDDGIVLRFQRNLTDNSLTPAELFEFGPDQVFLFPSLISPRNFTWREVAP